MEYEDRNDRVEKKLVELVGRYYYPVYSLFWVGNLKEANELLMKFDREAEETLEMLSRGFSREERSAKRWLFSIIKERVYEGKNLTRSIKDANVIFSVLAPVWLLFDSLIRDLDLVIKEYKELPRSEKFSLKLGKDEEVAFYFNESRLPHRFIASETRILLLTHKVYQPKHVEESIEMLLERWLHILMDGGIVVRVDVGQAPPYMMSVYVRAVKRCYEIKEWEAFLSTHRIQITRIIYPLYSLPRYPECEKKTRTKTREIDDPFILALLHTLYESRSLRKEEMKVP